MATPTQVDKVLAMFKNDGYHVEEVLYPEGCFTCAKNGQWFHVEVDENGDYSSPQLLIDENEKPRTQAEKAELFDILAARLRSGYCEAQAAVQKEATNGDIEAGDMVLEMQKVLDEDDIVEMLESITAFGGKP